MFFPVLFLLILFGFITIGIVIVKYKYPTIFKKMLVIGTATAIGSAGMMLMLAPPVGSPPFENTSSLGWELLDDGNVIHAWNNYDNYYFNNSNGVQFSNHYEEYWTNNVLMVGYYSGGEWNLIYRTDDLSGFSKNFTGETDSFMNLTLWKDLSYGSYDFRLAIRYHLKSNDSDLTVIPYIKNLGISIPFDIGFGWELKDIQIANNQENDFFRLRDNASQCTVYSLHNNTLDESYTNLTYSFPEQFGKEPQNGSLPDGVTEYGGYTVWNWSYSPEFHLDNHKSNGESDQTLYLKWDENLDYKVTVKNRTGQYNAPVSLFIKVGTLGVGQEKSTILQWYDAYITVGSEYQFEAGETVYIATATINETDFLVCFMDDADNDIGRVLIGRVAGDGSISYGTSVAFGTDVGIGLGLDICVVNSATNRFFIVYADDDQADDGYIYTSTFSEMVIDTDNDAWSEVVTGDLEHPAICKIKNDYAVICYNNESNAGGDVGEAAVVWWDGSNLQHGMFVELGSGTVGTPDLDPFYTDCIQLDTDLFGCTFLNTEANSRPTEVIGSVSGTTITMGAAGAEWSASYAAVNPTINYYSNDDIFVSGHSVDGFFYRQHSFSGNTLTYADADSNFDFDSDRFTNAVMLDDDTIAFAFADSSDSDIGKTFTANISWDAKTIEYSPATIFNNGATAGVIADIGIGVCRMNSTHWIVAFNDATAGKCVMGHIPSAVAPPPGFDGHQWNTTIFNNHTDYFIWLGSNSSAWNVSQQLTGFDEAGEYIAVWQNQTWDADNGSWQRYNGNSHGINFTIKTFQVIQILLSESGTQVVNMHENHAQNYTNSQTYTWDNKTWDFGFNYTGKMTFGSDSLSDINTSVGLEAGEYVGLWNRTHYKFIFYNADLGITDDELEQFDVIVSKVEDTEVWNT